MPIGPISRMSTNTLRIRLTITGLLVSTEIFTGVSIP